MPCAAVRVDARVGRLGEGLVHALALGQSCRAVDGRPHERVAEPYAAGEIDQTGGLRGSCGLRAESETAGRLPEQRDVADRLGCGREQEASGLGRERFEPPLEALLDPTRQGRDVQEPESTRKLGRRQSTR